MSLRWVPENPARWDDDKNRIIGGAADGIFSRRLRESKSGDLIPGEWWRVEKDDKTVGYCWLDVVWGDAEVLLAVAESARHQGVGGFILEQLEKTARERGLHRLYNVVPPSHPEHDEVTQWLQRHGYVESEGLLSRFVAQAAKRTG